MKPEYRLLVICIVVSALVGALAGFLVMNYVPRSDSSNIASFYSTENSVGISPSDYVTGKVSGTLVDLRDPASYASGHLQGAINIPVEQMTYSQVLAAFKSLPANQPIMIYCYSSYCMLSIEVGNYLAQNGIYVKHFNLGAAEIDQDFSNYLVNGTQPGQLNTSSGSYTGACSSSGSGFGC